MSWIGKLLGRSPATPPALAVPAAPPAAAARLAEAAPGHEAGWRRLSGEGQGGQNERDLSPMAQGRMQKLAEHLWQANVLANRLIELPLAYLLAEGVTLQAADEQQQAVLDRHWFDPINNWPAKLEARVRALALLGEQCYTAHVGPDGMVRLGYLDPRRIAQVVMDPDNPEQPIGVVTQRDARGRYHKYRVIVLGDDELLFSRRTAQIRAEDFTDGECFLLQLNKLPDGSRGRSDLLGQMDWLDAYDEFLFGELDRIADLRRFVWDITMQGADQEAVEAYQKTFVPPSSNGAFVHNESMTLEPKSPALHAADTSESARLLRNHVLGGSTFPEHWFGGGADANRAIGESMSEPTFKVYTSRQGRLKLFLEEIGRYVLWKSSQQTATPDWSDPRWHVTAVFPELANRDVTKFAAALQSVVAAAMLAIDRGLLTEETALKIVADVASRFGQEIDPAAELEAARAQAEQRAAEQAQRDTYRAPALARAVNEAGRA
ncbi:hypothetical protein CK623_11455 [Vandammella animalimorsus]|uniref:Phage portal protein n=1 Tax=Vandammella animalimorsus TaxID=2029117 RepID=A0A2A2ANH1_9BURK|nr:hypothetical protein [Vandammella animalimorsus]PAT39169.1 hypothetical protein CK623_11455 [Vandammella animalimorsus]